MPSTSLAVPAQANTSPQPAISEPERDPKRRISKRIRKACDALVAGDCKTIKDAAALANLSREHLSRELSKPHVTAYLQQKAYRALAVSAARASAVKIELLDSDSDHVRNQASEFVLALAGIKPKSDAQVSVNIELKAGYVIDLSEVPKPAPITISHSELTHD